MESFESIKEKAQYCLNCKTKPCQKACPLSNDIPEAIKKITENDIKGAYDILTKTSPISAICGKICPHKKQCEGNCTRGIKGKSVEIGKIEEYIGNYAIKNNLKLSKENNDFNKKIAIIGGGPAGICCAWYLAKRGYKVCIYEKESMLGGAMYYGIPDFRLKKETIINTIKKITDLGITVKCNKTLGKDFTIKSLKKDYDAVFLGIGAKKSIRMNIAGEDLENVYYANDLLMNNGKISFENKNVTIIGGGDVALDIARTIKKNKAKEIKILYRRTKKEMPAYIEEIRKAQKEGIKFFYLTSVKEIIGDKKAQALKCVRTNLIHKEGEDRPFPIDIPNSEFKMPVDIVIIAIGLEIDKKIVFKENLKLNEKNYIAVDDYYMTNIEGVFSAGDAIGEKATVAFAARSGIQTAKNIEKMLKVHLP